MRINVFSEIDYRRKCKLKIGGVMKYLNCINILLWCLFSVSFAVDKWSLVYHETFDEEFNEPTEWIEDAYGDDSPYHVGPFDEDGEYFHQQYGSSFQTNLDKFRSFRKSFTYGEDGWLTVELYGRDSNKDGIPETGGAFKSVNGKAKLISTSHTDGAIITSTKELPSRYRVEVTISNINFGGEKNGSWEYDGKKNGYDGGEMAGPWKPGNVSAVDENGIYFLCILDYAKPAPHNNVFIHHHRKVVMDSDNNNDGGYSWSKVWNPNIGAFENDGSHYISMIWLNGESFGSDNTGNHFVSYTPAGWQTKTGVAHFGDKYLDNESYTFTIERNKDEYTMSVTGKFYYGGTKTYIGTRKCADAPVIWHYNQKSEELNSGNYNEVKNYNGKTFNTWPENSFYPDYFFFGDPHINYYEGTAEYDDLKLYLMDSTPLGLKKHTINSCKNFAETHKVFIGLNGIINISAIKLARVNNVELFSVQGKKIGDYGIQMINGAISLKSFKRSSKQLVIMRF